MNSSKFSKVESIINSCETYDQIKSCFSFVSNLSFFSELCERTKVLGLIQKKAYSMRNEDLKFHRVEVKQILNF